MEAAIASFLKKRALGGATPERIEELMLDSARIPSISGLEPYVNLQRLSLNGCGITSLDGLPALRKLTKLDVSDNKITHIDAIARLTNLRHLNLSGNRIASEADLAPLFELKQLEYLDLYGCPVATQGKPDAYKANLYGRIPTLKALDGTDKYVWRVSNFAEDIGFGSGKGFQRWLIGTGG